MYESSLRTTILQQYSNNTILHYIPIVTSLAKEVMFFGSVGLSVCLSVCLFVDNITQKVINGLG